MAEKNGETQPKKEHPAVTLSKKFESTRKEIGRLEHDGVEKNKDRIEELHREALDILKQMKELDDRSVRNIERDLRTSETIFYLEQQLNPIIEEAETVLSDAEIEEKAIRELLAETDKEKGEITARKAELQAEIKAEQQKEKEISEIEPPQPQSPKATVETIKPKRVKKPKQPKVNPPKAPVAQTPPEDPEVAPGVDQESWILQEVDAFIAEFGLEELLPPDFRKLKQEQQLKTIHDLKHRIVDIVKQDAKAHYNEAVGGEKARANIFGKLAIGVREAFKKETNIKNAERNEFEKIKGTEEGRALVAEQMKLLAEINGEQEIVVGADGKLLIDYSEQLGIGTGSGQAELRAEYNTAANAFRSIPYEWGLAKEGSREKMAYEDAKAAYDTAVEKVLEVKKFAPGQEAKAIKDMMEIKNSLMLEQFLNTHPEIEIELGKLEQGAGKEQIQETILRLVGIQNREKAALFAAGYGARVITKATLGAMAAPIVGAVFGYLRAKSRAKETLIEKGKEARYGGVDNGPGVMNVASTEFKDSKGREAGLHYKLEALIQEIEQKQSRNEDCTNLIARLNSRIMYTRNKIDAGLVNFGGQKEVLKNQYLLLDALNRAIVLVSAAELNVKKEVDKRLESILAIRSKRMSKEYIEDQAVLGAVRGAGIATAGYIVRAIGEEIGLWGVQETTPRPYAEEQPDSKPFSDSRYMGEKSVTETQDTLIVNSDKVAAAREYLAQAEDHYKKAQEYYDAADDVEKKNFLPGLQHAKAELDFQRKFLEDTERGINPPTENSVASGETAAPKDTSTASIVDKGAKAQPQEQTTADSIPGTKTKPAVETEETKPVENGTGTEKTEVAKAPEDNVAGKNKSGGGPAEEKTEKIEKPKVNERPVKRVKQDTGSVGAKPRNIPSAPEVKDLPAGLDAKAVVGEGGGITFAFKQQLEGNNELAEALKKQIGFTGKIGTKAFYEALGKEFGYIKENGEWIGVKDGNVAAYQFEKNGDEYIVTEYHKINGVWKENESHDMEGSFEGKDYEKEYEYLNKPKRQVEDEEGDEDKPMRGKTGATKQQPIEEGRTGKKVGHKDDEENSMQLMEASKEETAQLEKSLFSNKKSIPDGENNNVPTNKNFRKDMTVPPTGEPRTAILEPDKQDVKWRIEPGPPDGRPTVVEDFKLVGPKALRMFADRYGYENLNDSQVKFVGDRYRFNLNKIFARSEDWTDKWSKEPATRLLRVNVGDNVSGNKEKLANYIQMLHDEVKKTGKTMEPFNDGFVGNKETTKDYILRMLFELEKRGKLDAFNDKFDNFMKGHGDLGSGYNTPEVPDTENAVEFNPAKTDMYELWEKYKKQPESLSEEEYTFAEKVEGLRKKLGSNFSSIQTGETAEHYLKRLESKTK